MQAKPPAKDIAIAELLKEQGLVVVARLLTLTRPAALQLQAAAILQACAQIGMSLDFTHRK